MSVCIISLSTAVLPEDRPLAVLRERLPFSSDDVIDTAAKKGISNNRNTSSRDGSRSGGVRGEHATSELPRNYNPLLNLPGATGGPSSGSGLGIGREVSWRTLIVTIKILPIIITILSCSRAAIQRCLVH